MSIGLIYEVYEEVKKLIIAGSEMAIDNNRLKKILPGMKKSGESVQIFKRVADAMEKTISSKEGMSQDNLLELANLINAVVYTQGQTGIDGDFEKIDSLGLDVETSVSYRALNPVINALTTKGSGRHEIIRKYYEDYKNEKDLRILVPLITGLGDGYPDISNLAYDMLKGYGDSITPLLERMFNIEGGKKDGRILELICELNGQGVEFFKEAIQKGSLEVKVYAIKALGKFPETEDILFEYSRDRKKEIREASYYALSKFNTARSINRLFEEFKSKDRDSVMGYIRNNSYKEVWRRLLQEGEDILVYLKAFEKSRDKEIEKDAKDNVKDDAKEDIKVSADKEKERLSIKTLTEYFGNIVECMIHKKDSRIYEFLKRCVHIQSETGIFKENNMEDVIITTAAKNIISHENADAYDFLVSTFGKYRNIIVGYSFEAALLTKSPEYVFDTYSPLLQKKSFEKNEIIRIMRMYEGFYEVYSNYSYEAKKCKHNINWDKRWARDVLNSNQIDLGCKLITSGDKESIDILLEKLKNPDKVKAMEFSHIFMGLIKGGYSNVKEEIFKIVEDGFKNNRNYFGYHLYNIIDVLKHLPQNDLKELENIALKYNNKESQRFLNALLEI